MVAIAVIEVAAMATGSSRTSLAGLIASTNTVTRDRLRLQRADGWPPSADRLATSEGLP